jgi:glycosyltransferase involved in cell wall biosynthesis
MWYNPGNMFERSVVFVPFGREDLDTFLTPTIRYIERKKNKGFVANLVQLAKAVFWARKLILEEQCDVARVNGPNLAALIALPLRFISPIPMLVFIEAFWEDILPQQSNIPNIIRKIMPLWYRLVYRSFDAYCGTPTVAAAYYVNLGMKREAIAPWRNEINLPALAGADAHVPSTVLQSSHPRLVTVGRLHNEKLTTDLIRVLVEVKKKAPTASLVLVGEGPLRETIESLSKDLEVHDSVIFTGSVSTTEAFAIVGACDVYAAVMQGTALVEAMAAGKPIVAYDNAPHRTYLHDGKDSVLVANRDVQAMANAIVRLLCNSPEMTRISRAAAEEAWTKYGSETIAAEIYAGFEQAWKLKNSGDKIAF